MVSGRWIIGRTNEGTIAAHGREGRGGTGKTGPERGKGKQPRRNGILFVWGGVWLGVGDEVRSCSCHLLPGKKEE